MRKAGRWVLALWLVVPLAVTAETVYVLDRLQVGLRDARDGKVVKSLESGAVLEILERDERFARVRDKQGAEGWLESRYLGTEPPVRLQLIKLQDELNKTRDHLAAAQAQLKNPGANATTVSSAPDLEYELDYLWLAVGLVMLIVGFVAGVLWHRESIRRRMGGMYLKI